MRYAVATLVCLAAGCEGRAGPDADTPRDFDSVDVLVSSTRPVAWVNFPDGRGPRLAQPGECAEGETDGQMAHDSCFDSLQIGGATLRGHGGPSGITNPLYGDAVTSGDATLHLIGCGRSADVPVHPGAFPSIDVHKTVVGNDLVVAWTSPDAASVLNGVGGGFGITYCNDPANAQRTFAGIANSPLTSVELRALRAPEITETVLGEVRVWYGDVTSASTQSSAN